MKGKSIMDIKDKQVTDEELEAAAGGYQGFYVCANCGEEFDGYGELMEHSLICTGK